MTERAATYAEVFAVREYRYLFAAAGDRRPRHSSADTRGVALAVAGAAAS